jgi:hypothetical protein
MKKEKTKYKLIVKIGKKGKELKFNTNDPITSLLSIKIPKLTEGVIIKLVEGKKTAQRGLLSFQARRIFNSKINAQFFVKTLNWLLK